MRRAAALAACGALAGVTAASSSEATTESVVIRLIAVGTSSRSFDEPPVGPSDGDRVIETSRLSNQVAQFGKAKGKVVGSDRATLTVVGSSFVKMDGVATLPVGTIVLRGRITATSSTHATIPVVGGTRRYAKARGTLTVTQVNQRRAVNVYRLTLP